jgi:hypothetical protein
MSLLSEISVAMAWTGYSVWVWSRFAEIWVPASAEWVGVGYWWSTAGTAVLIEGLLVLVL